MDFQDNNDTDGVYYTVTLDQLKKIINGKIVLVKIVGVSGFVDKAFGPDNKYFFQEFLDDPIVNNVSPPPTQNK